MMATAKNFSTVTFPVCDAAIDVANGDIGYDPDEPYGDSNERFEGVSATVTCNANYGLDGPESALCTSGQWTEAALGPCLPCVYFTFVLYFRILCILC